MTIFNGNISSIYKKEQFRIWLETYNKQYSTNITFIDRLVEPSVHSGWISGFTDAEGCFYGRVKSCWTSKLKRAPHLTFQINQKELYIIKILRDIFLNVSQPSTYTCEYKNVIGQNEVFKDLTLKNINYDKSWNGWSFHCSSFTKLKVIRNYFSRYQLKTKNLLHLKNDVKYTIWY